MGKLGMIVVAAGKGTRMGTTESKQYLMLGDKPILVHTLEVMERCEEIAQVVLVVGNHDVKRAQHLVDTYQLRKCSSVIVGGTERQSSVYAGLQALDADTEWVMVHDGVRPFVEEEHIRKLLKAVQQTQAAVLGVPVKDTIKLVHAEGWIESTPDRSKLWAIQTPQVFQLKVLLEAHQKALQDGFVGTDDAMLVERNGNKVHIVEGAYTNIKITTPEDLHWASYWLKELKGGDD